jgi:hypothetical protein
MCRSRRPRASATDKLGVLMRKRLLALLREHGEDDVRGDSVA